MRIIDQSEDARTPLLRLWTAPSWPSTPAPAVGRCVEWCGRRLEPSSYALLGLVRDPGFDATAFDQERYVGSTAALRDQVRYGLMPEYQSTVHDWLGIWGVEAHSLFGAHGEISSSETSFAIAATFLARTSGATWAAPDQMVQAEWTEARRLVTLHYNYVRKYRQALDKLGSPPTAQHGTASSALAAMPAALRSLYHSVGDHPFNSAHNRLLDPGLLRSSGEKCIFLEENQLSVVWAIDVKPMTDDPTVWQGQPDNTQEGGYRWYAEDNPLSDFMIEMWEWLADQQ